LVGAMLAGVFAPGLFDSSPVHAALLAGTVVAVVSGAVGVVTVLRGQSFAGHALGDLGTLGGSGAFLAGLNPLWGFAGVGVVVAGTMELFGVQRRRGRDVATGIVLGAALGVSALFLYLDTIHSSTTGATVTILFGSLFTVSGSTTPAILGLGLAGLAVVGLLYRPLLLSSLSPDLAAARGIRVRALGVVFLMLVGVAVSLSSVAVGTILSTALLIGPAATALRVTSRPLRAMALAGALGCLATWIGIVLAYDSYYWPPSGRGWPVSFFVVTLIFLAYLAVDVAARFRTRRRRPGSSAPQVAAGDPATEAA
jgi:zinc/manganese transport system permease protein